MASFMGMGGGMRREPLHNMQGLGGDTPPVQQNDGMEVQPMQKAMSPENEAVRERPQNPWGGPSNMPRNGGINPNGMYGGGPMQAMGGNPQQANPWSATGQLNYQQYIPEWAKPKQPAAPVPGKELNPIAPTGDFKDIAGFGDYDAGMSGSLAQGQDLMLREAKARGADTSKWTPEYMNGIANQIGYSGGNLNGAQFNKARRLLFGG